MSELTPEEKGGTDMISDKKAPTIITPPSQKIPNYMGFANAMLLLLVLILGTAHIMSAVTPVKWEYKITAIPDGDFDTSMNKYGVDGWELIFARRATSGSISDSGSRAEYEVIFKRPIKIGNPVAKSGL